MTEKSSNLPAPDLAKGFGIILVVFGHVLIGLIKKNIIEEPSWDTLIQAIYLFHMPLFFFISGLFFPARLVSLGITSFLKTVSLSLLTPLVVWSYIQFSLQYLSGNEANNSLSLFDVSTAPFPPRQQFWFLWVLFIIFSLSSLVWPIIKERVFLLFVSTTFFLFSAVLTAESFSFVESGYWSYLIGQTLLHLPFFLLGALIGPHQLQKNVPSPLMSFCLLIIVLIAGAFYAEPKGFPSTLLSIGCVLFLYFFSAGLSSIKTPKGRPFPETLLGKTLLFIGRNSMIIYLAHVIAGAGFRSFLLHYSIKDPTMHILGGTIVGVVAPLVLLKASYPLRKNFPKTLPLIIPGKPF